MKLRIEPAAIRLEFSRFMTSGFYTGEFPFASGTAGSFAYLSIWYFVLSTNFIWQFVAFILVTIIGWLLVADILPRIKDEKIKKPGDPSWIVIDEWAGLGLALLAVQNQNVWQILLAFALFRLFDASKIWPVSLAEKMPGAKGVMMDDLVAGGLAGLLCMLVFNYL